MGFCCIKYEATRCVNIKMENYNLSGFVNYWPLILCIVTYFSSAMGQMSPEDAEFCRSRNRIQSKNVETLKQIKSQLKHGKTNPHPIIIRRSIVALVFCYPYYHPSNVIASIDKELSRTSV